MSRDKDAAGDAYPAVPGVDFESLRRQLAAALAQRGPPWLAEHREDLMQTALTRLVTVLRERGGEINATYVWKTAYCVMMDEVRRAYRRHEVPLTDESAPVHDSSRSNPERSVLSRETGVHVRECLARLVPSRRRAVALRFLGHTPIESARKLGVSAKRVSNLVYRGLADLRRCLEAKGIQP